MSTKLLFPVISSVVRFFKPDSKDMIDKDLRRAAIEMGPSEFYEKIKEIKKGRSVRIGTKSYSRVGNTNRINQESEETVF